MKKKKEIYKVLLDRIVKLHYKPGEVLNENALCKEFGVSRTPIREVLIQLSEMDLVSIKPKVGTFVSFIDTRMLKYVYETKTPLEGLVAELASQRALPDNIRQMEEIVEELKSFSEKESQTFDYYHERDREFHRLCCIATQNPFLVRFLDELHIKSMRFLNHIAYETNELDWYTDTLSDILDGIRGRNGAKAKDAAVLHNHKFIKKLSEYFFGLELD